jgi:hypothetical protein
MQWQQSANAQVQQPLPVATQQPNIMSLGSNSFVPQQSHSQSLVSKPFQPSGLSAGNAFSTQASAFNPNSTPFALSTSANEFKPGGS